MNIQLSENLFGNTGPSGTMISSQSMFSAHDSAQATRPDSDLSSHPTRPSVYDDRQALDQGDFERTLNRRIDSLEQRERAPVEENPDPSPRADVAERSDDRPIHRSEGPQETRRSDPAPAADETPESEKASQNKATTESDEARLAQTTRKESVSRPREGETSRTPQGPIETKTGIDLSAHADLLVTEKSSQTRGTPVKSNPTETGEKSTLLASLQSGEKGFDRRAVFNPEATLKQHPKAFDGDPSTRAPANTQINTPFPGAITRPAGIKSAVQASDAGQSAPKEVAAEVLPVSKNQAGQMIQSAKASFFSSVESDTAQTRPGAARPGMNVKDGFGQGAPDESEMLRPADGTKPAAARAQSGSTGSGRLDPDGLKLQTLTHQQRVAATGKQQPDEVTETNKTQANAGSEDLSLRKSQPWSTHAGSAHRYLSGRQTKLTPA
ncbi:MAG: hypothetical protein IIA65_07400, partial [Planctomycetes bacterium]|nr:hypothetical protein [Planctomycetota bacterium]